METEKSSAPVTLALTGASGAVYGFRLARMLLEQGKRLNIIFSAASEQVVLSETGMNVDSWIKELSAAGELVHWDLNDYSSPAASGSAPSAGMIIAPCSMGTLGRISSGISSNLIERAADVCLKERRPLILMCRETPLSSIHLENMVRADRAGAVIMPPVPAFYTGPKTIDDIVNHSCNRVLRLLGFECSDAFEWGGGKAVD